MTVTVQFQWIGTVNAIIRCGFHVSFFSAENKQAPRLEKNPPAHGSPSFPLINVQDVF